MLVDLKIDDNIQIETTTRCTLKCPACSRTQFVDKVGRPVPTRDIDPDILWNFFDCDTGKKIKRFRLCGDWGDSIYYPRLFDLIDKFRDTKTFHITTNGSYKKLKFWQELISRLDHNDTVEFSIDGLEDTNHLYRRNSDWKSIMMALQAVSNSTIQLEWSTNVFSFNYQHVPAIKSLAESFGAKFNCKLTHRFGDPSLRPPDRFVRRDVEFYSDLLSKQVSIIPKCQSVAQNCISSYHMYVPCGWFCAPFVFYNSVIWRNKDRWSIKNTTMDALLENVLKPWIANIYGSPETAPVLCKMKCRPGQPSLIFHE